MKIYSLVRKYKNIILYLLWSSLFTLTFNVSLIIPRLFSIITNDHFIDFLLIKEIIISTIIVFIAIAAFSFNKKTLLIFTTIMTFITSIMTYFVINYKINVDHHIFYTFFDTDKREALEFISISFLIWVVSHTVISYLIVSNIEIKQFNKTSILYFIAFILLSTLNGAKVNYKYFPYNIIKAIQDCIKHKSIDSSYSLKDHSYRFLNHAPEELYLVLIIGESSRADRLSLNGYYKDTTPNLQKIQNLVNFNQFYSFGNYTRITIPRMLSILTNNITTPNYSVIDIFNILKFQTVWFGAQGDSSFNHIYLRLAHSSKKFLFLNDIPTLKNYTDLNLIPYIQQYIDQSSGNHLITIHMLGSHWNFDDRVVKEFKRYRPICLDESIKNSMTTCSLKALSNSYDNTILQTDFFLSKIINMFEEKNALIFYISDHGESLGENRIYGHGSKMVKEQLNVAAMAWASDKFIQYSSQKFYFLKKSKDKVLNHDFIFHSLLDCAGVTSSAIVKELSLCASKILNRQTK